MKSERNAAQSQMVFVAVALGGLVVGVGLYLGGWPLAGDVVWALTTAVALVPAVFSVWSALRARRMGVDVIAVLALVGAPAVGEFFAGAVIALMLATGGLLEARAAARAQRDLLDLLSRAPRVAHRYEGGVLTSPSIDDVWPGDLLIVQSGEVVPADGRVESGSAVVDESMLTGEPLPVERVAADVVRSGSVNAGAPFDIRVTTPPAQSAYADIVRLVRDAQASSAPFVRLADRYAIIFVPATLLVAGLAWAISGELVRAVAVLVVATPCPLILAAPVAIASGMTRTARRGVVVKGGSALERLAQGRVLLFDKTGTLTEGRPSVTDVVTSVGDEADLLRLAASLDQVSPHVLASSIVQEARERGLRLSLPEAIEEVAGQGIGGEVDGRDVRVGKWSWVVGKTQEDPAWVRRVRRRSELDGSLVVYVALDGEPVGAIVLDDRIRPDAARMIADLRSVGIERVVMVTGDRSEVADLVGSVLNVDDVFADRSPAEKVDVVRAAAATGPTIMVGDGVNDAPALASASVGVAMGTRGASASSEVADVVLTVDRLDRLAEAIAIGRRAHRVALESVLAGMGMSLCAMAFAAFGFLPPAVGAVLQEGIDVAVIINALRALTGGHLAVQVLTGADAEMARRFAEDHRRLRPELKRVRVAAADLGALRTPEAVQEVRCVYEFLADELLAHEDAEHTELYPILRRAAGESATSAPTRAYIEIRHLIRRVGRLLDEIGTCAPDADDVRDLQQILYGLDAVLNLHFAEEEEQYFSLTDASSTPVSPSSL